MNKKAPLKLKPYPRQTYSLLSSNRPILKSLLSMDYIKGHRVRTDWASNQADLTTKELNTTYIDSVLADCALDGRKIGLGLSGGVGAPAALWEQKGVTKYTLRPEDITMENSPPYLSLPWEEKVQKYWFNVIKQLGIKYEKNSLVSYVVVSGFMQGFENRFVGSTEGEADVQALAKQAGYFDFSEAWTIAAQAIVDQYALAFPTTCLLLTVATVIPSDKKLNDNLLNWAKAKYPGRFGNMSASLKATLPPHSPNTNPAITFPKWDQPIFSSADHPRFYGKGMEPVPYPNPPQPCNDLLRNAISNDKNDFGVELYEYDAKDPINADTIRACNIEFEANAAKAEAIRAT